MDDIKHSKELNCRPIGRRLDQ